MRAPNLYESVVVYEVSEEYDDSVGGIWWKVLEYIRVSK